MQNNMFTQYPKKRSVLSEDYKKIYVEHYQNNRLGKTNASAASSKMEVWLHKKVAQDLKNITDKSTLEIGAGTLNQLKYEQTQVYDIIEPFKDLYEDSVYLDKIRNIYNDISDISLTNTYNRITSIATFEHITNLPEVVARTCFLLKPKGSLRVSIPNEGTLLWKAGYKFTTGLEFKRKYKLDYEVIMRHEHVNNADEIEQVLKYFYKTIKCSCFGISKKIAFYRFYECSNPNIEHASLYLKQIIPNINLK